MVVFLLALFLRVPILVDSMLLFKIRVGGWTSFQSVVSEYCRRQKRISGFMSFVDRSPNLTFGSTPSRGFISLLRK